MAFTYFFRDYRTLELSVDCLVPEVVGRSRVRIWDAGCAGGQEPYTLAMVLSERMGRFAFRNVRITATDVDEGGVFGRMVEEGVYPEGDLRRIPEGMFEKYFRYEGGGMYRVVEVLRERVEFVRHDLLSMEPVGEGFSMVVCKNVLLHFSRRERVEVMRMFHRSLAPGGFLVVEQTQDVPWELEGFFERVSGECRVLRRVEREVCHEWV